MISTKNNDCFSNYWGFGRCPSSDILETRKKKRFGKWIRMLGVHINIFMHFLFHMPCSPRLEAWKLSCGEIFSICADSRDRGRIERSSLMRSTAYRKATSCRSSAGWNSPPGTDTQSVSNRTFWDGGKRMFVIARYPVWISTGTVPRVGQILPNHNSSYPSSLYVGVLISLWLFLFPICSTTKRIFLGWVKQGRTTKS
jgi:hypothetical protein